MIGIGQNLSVSAAYLHTSGASLEYDFTLGTLAPISGREAITFTRSTVATVINAIGQVETLAINQPRFDHDPTTIAQQNLLIYSEQFDNAGWTKLACSITSNTVVAPSGSQTGDTLTADAGSASKLLYQDFTGTAAPYTNSVYAKAGTVDWIGLTFGGDAIADGAFFDVSSGAVGTVAAGRKADIKHVGDGWYRCSLTKTLAGAPGNSLVVTVHSADNQAIGWTAAGTESVYVWGAQTNATSTPNTPNLISNGTFDTDVTGWSASGGASAAVVLGEMQVMPSAGFGGYITSFPTVVGSRYKVSGLLRRVSGAGSTYFAQTTSGGGDVNSSVTSTSSTAVLASFDFVATDTTSYVMCRHTTNTGVAGFDNMSCKLVVDLPYTPTTSAAAAVKYARKGLLIEEARTNLLTRSSEFDHADWLKNNQTVTANTVTSPDGTVNGDTVTVTAGNSVHMIYQASSDAATTYAASVYAKAGTVGWIAIKTSGSGVNVGAWFNLTAGVVGTVESGVTATIEQVGSGWYLCCVVRSAAVNSNFVIEVHDADNQSNTWTAAGTETVYLYGAQKELGGFATSYIPTTTAAVTRAQDSALVSNVTPWYNSTEGTIVLEADNTGQVSAAQGAVCLSNNSDQHEILIYAYDNAIVTVASNGGTAQASFSSSPFYPGLPYKVAFAYKANDFGASLDGGAASSDVSGAVPTAASKLNIGARFDGSIPCHTGHIRKLAYHPRRIPDAELVMLTA